MMLRGLALCLFLASCAPKVTPSSTGTAPVYIDGVLKAYAAQVSIQTGSQPQPTPTPVPVPTPTAAPQPTPPPSGSCPAGYTVLDRPMSFCANCWGLDGIEVPPGQTQNYCALMSADAPKVKVMTADRTGSYQCSNVTLTVAAPDGRAPVSSTALNNTIAIPGTTPPDYLAPKGAYLISLYGNDPHRQCITQTVMLYWQY